MKLVYTAGPFRSHTNDHGQPNQWHQERNINSAASVALSLWQMGFAVVCPHLNTRPFQGALPDESWIAGDLRIIEGCDYLVLCPGWQQSKGSLKEKAFAESRGIPVFEWDETMKDGCRYDERGFPTWIRDLA
jgi:hypothetical protein